MEKNTPNPLTEKKIRRAGGIRNYINLLKRSFKADARNGILRAEGTSRRQCEKMLAELDKLEKRLAQMYPHLITI